MNENPLILRARVAEAVAKRFIGQPLAWGEFDCARLAHETLRGLKLSSPFDVPRYTSERGALKAMRRAGFKSLEAVMDAAPASRIAPAMALPADILGFRTEHAGFGMAIGLMLSGGKCVAFIDHDRVGGLRAVLGQTIGDAYAAWRLRV